MKKRIGSISAETMAALSRYRWPGNVRELENFIERAVILTRGSELEAPLGDLTRRTADAIQALGTNGLTTLEDAEREHIRRALEHANWQVGGPSGAAAMLGIKPTTLQARMARLGITRPSPWTTRRSA